MRKQCSIKKKKRKKKTSTHEQRARTTRGRPHTNRERERRETEGCTPKEIEEIVGTPTAITKQCLECVRYSWPDHHKRNDVESLKKISKETCPIRQRASKPSHFLLVANSQSNKLQRHAPSQNLRASPTQHSVTLKAQAAPYPVPLGSRSLCAVRTRRAASQG